MKTPFQDLNHYQKFRENISSNELKWKSNYNFESSELQALQQTQPNVNSTYVFNLSVPTSLSNPVTINEPGRAFCLYGHTTGFFPPSPNSSTYDPVNNIGIETLFTNSFIWVMINKLDVKAGVPLHSARGYILDFERLFLIWPTQSLNNAARLIIYKNRINQFTQNFGDVPT